VGLHIAGHKAGPQVTPAVALAARMTDEMSEVPLGQAVVPTGPRQPTLVMFQAIVALLNRGTALHLPVVGQTGRQTTPVVAVDAVTRINPNVHRVVPTGARHELATRVQPRGQIDLLGRGTQMTPAPPMTERPDALVGRGVGLAVGAPVVRDLQTIQPEGQVVVPGLPWQPPPLTLKKLEGQEARAQVRPEKVGPWTRRVKGDPV
jgi:hypothetical protein